MTKKELIEALKDADDYADVFFYNHRDNRYYMIDFAYFNGKYINLEEKDI